MVGKRVVRAGCIPLAIDKGVVPHVFVSQTTRLQDGANSALKLDFLPAALEKPVIIGKVWIAADKVGARALAIQSDDVCQRGFKKQRFVRITEIVQLQQVFHVLLGHIFRPCALCGNHFRLGHGFKIPVGHFSFSFAMVGARTILRPLRASRKA